MPILESTCPACGSEFLADLGTARAGRHRSSGWRWPASRGASLALAGVLAVVLAVGLPLLLALVG